MQQWLGWLQTRSLNGGMVQVNWTTAPRRRDIDFLIRVLEIVREGYDRDPDDAAAGRAEE